MSTVSRDIWHCDICGFEWVRTAGIIPEQCPSRKCRSRKWNINGGELNVFGGSVRGAENLSSGGLESRNTGGGKSGGKLLGGGNSAPGSGGGNRKSDLKVAETSTEKGKSIASDETDAEVVMCPYTEYDMDSGETYRCGRAIHGPKVKHTRGAVRDGGVRSVAGGGDGKAAGGLAGAGKGKRAKKAEVALPDDFGKMVMRVENPGFAQWDKFFANPAGVIVDGVVRPAHAVNCGCGVCKELKGGSE
jgi:hypothetical protein